jgi:hypothetical protein
LHGRKEHSNERPAVDQSIDQQRLHQERIVSLSEELDQYNKTVSAWLDQARKETAAIQRLQKAVESGNVRDVEKLRQAAQLAAANVQQRAESCPPFEFDTEAYLAREGGFIPELMEAAEKAGVRLSERDGNIFSYPVLVQREPAGAAIRIDKKLVSTLRPETVAAILKKAQSKEPKARPGPFIEALFDAYELLRARRKLDAYIDLPLTGIYEVMTLLPRTDYTLLDFTRDLYFLDTSDVHETRKGFRMSLTASTVSRERSVKILRFVTRDGYEKDFAAIKFTPPGGRE